MESIISKNKNIKSDGLPHGNNAYDIKMDLTKIIKVYIDNVD